MDRIDGANTIDLGGGNRGFRDRNLVAGLAGTQVTAEHMNSVQEEVMAVIEEAGLTPDAGNLAQLLEAANMLYGGGGLLANPGWQRLPGGLIVQWRRNLVFATDGAGQLSGAWTFPITFPTAVLGVAAIATSEGSPVNAATIVAGLPTLSGLPLYGAGWPASGTGAVGVIVLGV